MSGESWQANSGGRGECEVEPLILRGKFFHDIADNFFFSFFSRPLKHFSLNLSESTIFECILYAGDIQMLTFFVAFTIAVAQ